MFIAFYRWKLKSGKESQFRRAWSEVTLGIREKHGSFGSRLHRCEDGTWAAYAQWPSKRKWQARRPLDAAGESARRKMSDAVAKRFPARLISVTDDHLVQGR